MAHRLWSTRFLKLYVAGVTQIYTVPAGRRAVVRCIAAYNADSAAGLAYVQVAYSTVWARSLPGSTGLDSTGLHHVAHSGEPISAYIQGPTMNLMVCGYLLEDPASEPAPNVERVYVTAEPWGQLDRDELDTT